MLLLTAAYAALFTSPVRATLEWKTVGVIALLVIAGEFAEFFSSAVVITRGGSKKGALFAVIASIVGSFFGASLGSIVPVVGTLVGVIVGASAGAMAGAMYGEYLAGKEAGFRWEIGKAAFWARLWGSIAKIAVAWAVIGIALVAILS